MAFEEAFGDWLQTERPGVLKSLFASGEYPFATSEDALVAIALVGDFVAQSDTYPLEG